MDSAQVSLDDDISALLAGGTETVTEGVLGGGAKKGRKAKKGSPKRARSPKRASSPKSGVTSTRKRTAAPKKPTVIGSGKHARFCGSDAVIKQAPFKALCKNVISNDPEHCRITPIALAHLADVVIKMMKERFFVYRESITPKLVTAENVSSLLTDKHFGDKIKFNNADNRTYLSPSIIRDWFARGGKRARIQKSTFEYKLVNGKKQRTKRLTVGVIDTINGSFEGALKAYLEHEGADGMSIQQRLDARMTKKNTSSISAKCWSECLADHYRAPAKAAAEAAAKAELRGGAAGDDADDTDMMGGAKGKKPKQPKQPKPKRGRSYPKRRFSGGSADELEAVDDTILMGGAHRGRSKSPRRC